MSRLTKNVVANFGGQIAGVAVGLVTVPFYIKYLGVEGYGIAGFLVSIQAMVAVLDFGLSTGANREVSKMAAVGGSLSECRDLIRSLELFYFAVAILVFIAGAIASPYLATNWLKVSGFSNSVIVTCLVLGCGSIALRWPTALYQGVLRGFERQVEMNMVGTLAVLVRGFGTILLLAYVSPSVELFFWAQLIFSFFELVAFGVFTWRHCRQEGAPRPVFRRALVSHLLGYSTSVGGVSLFAFLIKQFDKVLMSKLLPIDQLGVYNAVNLASASLTRVVQPVQSATFPRFTRHHAKNDVKEFTDLFHQSSSLTAFMVCPLAGMMFFYARDVLEIWLNNSELAMQGAPVLRILSVAMIFNCQMNVPFAVQLAVGMTKLPLVANGIGAAVLVPLLLVLIGRFGMIGAAYGWLIFNALNILIVPGLMFAKIMRGHYWRWLLKDVVIFAALAVGVYGIAESVTAERSLFLRLAGIAIASFIYLGLSWGASPVIRVGATRFITIFSGKFAANS